MCVVLCVRLGSAPCSGSGDCVLSGRAIERYRCQLQLGELTLQFATRILIGDSQSEAKRIDAVGAGDQTITVMITPLAAAGRVGSTSPSHSPSPSASESSSLCSSLSTFDENFSRLRFCCDFVFGSASCRRVWLRGDQIVQIGGYGPNEKTERLEEELRAQAAHSDSDSGNGTDTGRLRCIEIAKSQLYSLSHLEAEVQQRMQAAPDHAYPDYTQQNLAQASQLAELCCFRLSADVAVICAGVILAVGNYVQMSTFFMHHENDYDIFSCGTQRTLNWDAFYQTPEAQPAASMIMMDTPHSANRDIDAASS